MDFGILTQLFMDIISMIALLWTIKQHFQIKSKLGVGDMLNTKDLDAMQELMDQFNADIKAIKAHSTATRAEVFDYVEQQLAPIARRLSTRASRERNNQEEDVKIQKKGGIIPFPQSNGANKQS